MKKCRIKKLLTIAWHTYWYRDLCVPDDQKKRIKKMQEKKFKCQAYVEECPSMRTASNATCPVMQMMDILLCERKHEL